MKIPRAARRSAVLASLLALAACGGGTGDANAPESEDALIARARGIHERAIVLDTHNDINPANFTTEKNYTMDLPTQVTLPKMEAGGTDVSWMVVYVGQGDLTPEGFAEAHEEALEKFQAIHRLTEEIAPDRIELALNSDDVRRIVASGKKVAMIGVENGYSIGTDLSNIQKFQEMGARYMSLSHNGHSQLCDSNTGERDDTWLYHGLSDLGRQAVAELNRVGIMIDLSHPSREANLQTMQLSQAPVIASHSSARALNDVSRNLSDEELMALKENGGVVQTVAFASYVNSAKNSAHQEAVQALRQEIADDMGVELMDRRAVYQMSEADREAYRAKTKPVEDAVEARMDEVNASAPPVDVADFVDHIDYLVQKVGIDHVGISSDFDGGGGVEGWDDASESFNVTLELVRRGYSEEDIDKLWSGNLLRVLDEVQAVANRLQAES
ncbi:MAG: dipeptidase [Gemmatimonadota bacterium]|jgi:microsomal dipeptidase-like Zn-dependent dipeptidase